jgi:alpha-ketoglutarate-dependent taurine dioxygenase
MGLGIGRTWQQVFRTEDRLKVEAACRAQRFDYVWLDEDVLETSCVRPAMTRHPVTGTECWFNQAQHWHVACLDPMLRQDLLDLFGANRMPRECTFGDGAPIADSIMEEILTAYRASEVAVQWQTGDVLIVDNIATAHGRDPYRGARELFVAMGTPHGFGS